MPLPFATTALTVIRPQAADGGGIDPQLASYGEDVGPQVQPVVVASGLRAHIGSPSGVERVVNGQQEYVSYRCSADPFDFQPRDLVVSSLTGLTYEVATCVRRDELPPLAHSQLTLTRNEGAAP